MRFVCFMLFLISFVPNALSQTNVRDKKADLERTKKKIQTQRKQLEKLKGKEDSIVKTLGQIDRKKAELQGRKSTLQKGLKNINDEIQRTGMSIEQRKERIRQHQGSISRQLRNMYMNGDMNYLRMFLASTSFDDLGQKNFLMKQWVEHDRKRLDEFQEEARNLALEKESLEEKKDRRKKDLISLEKTEGQILQEKKSKKKLLSSIKTQKSYYKRSIKELEQSSKNLEIMIHQFKSRPVREMPLTTTKSRFSQMRGKLLLPVRGSIEKKYGPYHDSNLNVDLYHKGVDIRAPEGAAVNAVFAGEIVYADWFAGYGKVVIVDHDAGYFTLYAHLSDILVSINQRVAMGQTLGRVGETESMKGAYLYLELREKGVTVNPLPWFNR